MCRGVMALPLGTRYTRRVLSTSRVDQRMRCAVRRPAYAPWHQSVGRPVPGRRARAGRFSKHDRALPLRLPHQRLRRHPLDLDLHSALYTALCDLAEPLITPLDIRQGRRILYRHCALVALHACFTAQLAVGHIIPSSRRSRGSRDYPA